MDSNGYRWGWYVQKDFRKCNFRKEKLNRMMAERTGKTYEQIEKDADRDYYMSADEAKKYGIVDKVLQ